MYNLYKLSSHLNTLKINIKSFVNGDMSNQASKSQIKTINEQNYCNPFYSDLKFK